MQGLPRGIDTRRHQNKYLWRHGNRTERLRRARRNVFQYGPLSRTDRPQCPESGPRRHRLVERVIPPVDRYHSLVELDASDPLFTQMGEDAREASSARGEEGVIRVVDHLAQNIDGFLGWEAP